MLCGNQGEAKSIYNPTSCYVNEILEDKEENLNTLLLTIWILEIHAIQIQAASFLNIIFPGFIENESYSLFFAFKS